MKFSDSSENLQSANVYIVDDVMTPLVWCWQSFGGLPVVGYTILYIVGVYMCTVMYLL